MKRPGDSVERLIRQSRPAKRADFVGSAEGEAVLNRILDEQLQMAVRRPSRKLLKIVSATVLVGLFGGGATAAIGGYNAPTAPPEAQPGKRDAFVCVAAGMQRIAEVGALIGNETPVDACRRKWSSAFGVEAPTHLFSCVQRVGHVPSPGVSGQPTPAGSDLESGWGLLVYVVEGNQFKNAAETCGSVGMLVAPTGASPAPSLAGEPLATASPAR